MSAVRAALELGMELHSDIEVVFRYLDRLDYVIVGRCSADLQTARLKKLTVFVVELVAVAVTLADEA